MLRQRTAPKVLVAALCGPGKEYAYPFLFTVMDGLEGKSDTLCIFDGVPVPDGVKGGNGTQLVEVSAPRKPMGKVDRIARNRNGARQLFLKGDWTHLYFHDSDVIPPKDIIPALLALAAPIATGLCPLRPDAGGVNPPIVSRALCSDLLTVHAAHHFSGPVIGCGMACCLITRSTLEQTAFREGAALEGNSEDFKFCADVAARPEWLHGNVVRLDETQRCWHVDADGMAYRLAVGDKERGAVWEDYPASVSNRFGVWHRGVPRFDLSAESMATLPQGFSVGEFARLSVEQARWQDVMAKES